MNEIKAIETFYNGYRFRSRLEARWAVFFDDAGIEYEYESEGYECDGIKYLPDFYLPQFDAHVEVKPDRPGIEKDIVKCRKMIQWGGAIKTIIFLGNVPPDSDGGHWHFPALYYETGHSDGGGVVSGWWFFVDSDDGVSGHVSSSAYPIPFHFNEDDTVKGMLKCSKIENGWKTYYSDVSVEPISDRYLKKEDPVTQPQPNVTYEDWFDFLKESTMWCNSIFYEALRKARQARFEHGECG